MVKSGGSAFDFVKVMSLGGAAGFLGDALAEITRMPFLNDPTFVYKDPTKSNFEAISYITGTVLTGLGFIDMITSVSIGGVGKALMPTGLGLIMGTGLYEEHGAKLLGIRPPDVHVPATPAAKAKYGYGDY